MSGPAPEEPREPRVGHLERYAREQPGAGALSDGARTVAWSEWNDLANRFADGCDQRGVKSGDKIGVRTSNRIEWFVVDAALSKLGATRVAISWRLHPREVRYVLDNSGARGLVFDDEDAAGFCGALFNEGRSVRERHLLVSIASTSASDAIAYADIVDSGSATARYGSNTESIVYTSGTSGRPKGVRRAAPTDAARRAALSAASDHLKRSISYRPGDRNLLSAPLSHAAAPGSALATHARGGCVYVMRRFDAEEALRWIERYRITVSFMVPTMLNRMVRLPEGVRHRYDLSSMRVITTGASVCPVELKRKVTALFGPCLYESYGTTETGLATIFTPEDMHRRPDSCGRVLDGVDVRIVDDEGRALPFGAVGQVAIRSPATIDAYLGETTLGPDTATEGYFATGDVGRLDNEGYLYILDRKKDMIISGGVNIYPAEIEMALREHPRVLDAAVFGIPNSEWGEEVKAVCERLPGQQVGESELMAFVANRLADFKRPRTIEFVDELPRNVAGKVLKRELRAPYWAGVGRVI